MAGGLDVHVPGIFIELNTTGSRHALAFVHGCMHQPAQVRKVILHGERFYMRQVGHGGNTVDHGIEDELGPLRGPQVRKSLAFRPLAD
jgi:hypothetical protein